MPGSPRSTRCGTAARGRATSSPCSDWAGSATSASSSRRRWASIRSAIARGKDKEPLAKQLGASVYIDSQAQDPAAELRKLGGAKVIVATATSGEAMAAVQGGLAVNGTLMIVGAAESLQVSPMFLLRDAARSRAGIPGPRSTPRIRWLQARTGVRSMNEIYPMERVSEAYDRMMSGKARFRVVLTIGNS